MKKLKIRILGIFAIFVVLIGMAGIAVANPDPCPAKTSSLWNSAPADGVAVLRSAVGNIVTYKVQTPNTGSVLGYPGVQELCVKQPNAPTSVVALYDSWTGSNPSDGIAQFIRPDGEPHNIPYDGIIHTVGDSRWNPDNPTNEQILVHIDDTNVCGAIKTCFRKPGQVPPPVPELSTIVLTASGLFGLVVATRKYKSK